MGVGGKMRGVTARVARCANVAVRRMRAGARVRVKVRVRVRVRVTSMRAQSQPGMG